MLRAVLPHAHAVSEPERVLARTHALDEMAPGVAVVRPPDQHRPAGDRVGRVRAQRPSQLGQREAPPWLLSENPERSEGAQQTVERARVGRGRRSELITRPRLVADQIRETERRRSVYHLRGAE